MGVRTSVEIGVSVGFGASLDDLVFQRDVSEVLDTLDHASAFVITLAGAEADTQIPFGDVTQPRMLYLEANGDVTVKLNGTGGDSILVKQPTSDSTSTTPAYLLTTAQFSTLHLTNPDASNSVRVRIVIVGDLVA